MSDQLQREAGAALQWTFDAGADDAIAGVGEGNNTRFNFRDGKVEQVQQSASRGLGLQLYVDGRYSTHNTTDLRPDQVRRFIADAVELTRHLEPDPHRVIPDPDLYEGRSEADLELVDESVPKLERDGCLEWLAAMDVANHDDARVISATGGVNFGLHRSARVSSNGFAGTQESTFVGYGSTVTLEEGAGRRPEAHHWVGAHHLDELPDPVEVARQSLERAQQRLGSAKAPSARATMVVDPEAGPGLLGRVGGALNGGAIQQNRSFLAGKKGEEIASELLTIRDEPLLKRGMGSHHFDDEGIAARSMDV